MGSYHVLNTRGTGPNFAVDVEYHLPVPDEMNQTNTINIRAALAADDDFEKTSDQATAGELTQLQSGELAKWVESFTLNENRPLTDHRQAARDRYNELAVQGPAFLHAKYRFLAFTEQSGVDF